MKIMAKKRIVHCASTTFGNNAASIVLANILNEIDNPYLTAKVSRFIHKYNILYKELRNLEHKEFILKVLLKNSFTVVDNMTWPNNVKNFVKNCLSTKFKKALE